MFITVAHGTQSTSNHTQKIQGIQSTANQTLNEFRSWWVSQSESLSMVLKVVRLTPQIKGIGESSEVDA